MTTNVRGAYIYVYQQPNSFNEKAYGTHGLMENNHLYTKVATGSFAVPADWSIYIVYNRGYLAGQISIDSWVEDYSGDDQVNIIEKYLETDTFFKNKDHLRLRSSTMPDDTSGEMEERNGFNLLAVILPLLLFCYCIPILVCFVIRRRKHYKITRHDQNVKILTGEND